MSKIFLAIIVVVIMCGCNNNNHFQLHTLPSGKQIKIIRVFKIYFQNGEESLKLDYETNLKLSDRIALKNEVNEIWKEFIFEAEKSHVNGAIISANEIPTGFIIKTGNSYNFVFHKQTDGSWREQ
jgi:hypothetical protein